MRKIILTLFILAVSVNLAHSTEIYSCPMEPERVNGSVGRFFSAVTGTNYLVSQIAEGMFEKELKKQTASKFKVKIDSYGTKTLTNGKFKSLKITSKNANLDGLNISNLEVTTQCGYNYIYQTPQGEIKFPENFILGFKGDITNDDLQATVNSANYKKYVSDVNLSLGKLSLLKVTEPKFTLIKNKIKYTSKVTSPLFMTSAPQEIDCDLDLKVQNNQIMFSNVHFITLDKRINPNIILPLINKLNPFTQEFEIIKDAKTIVRINDINVVNNTIKTEGTLTVPKNYTVPSTKKKAG